MKIILIFLYNYIILILILLIKDFWVFFMVDAIRELFHNDLISALFLSFIPLIELKGGIVFARGLGYNFFEAFGLSYLGSTLAVIPVFFLLKPLLKLIKMIKPIKTFADKIEGYIHEKAVDALESQKKSNRKKAVTENYIKTLCVLVFVAIPLPMTGIWMGTAIAVFLNLNFWRTALAGIIGNFVAGLIISLLAQICITLWDITVLDYILYGMFALAVVLLVFTIIKVVSHKRKVPNSEKGE